MMELKKFLISSVILLLLTSCSFFEPEVITKTIIIEKNIEIKQHPRPLQIYAPKWYAVSEKNLKQFIEKFKAENGDLAFAAISIRDYEKMSINMQEYIRYILQQKSIIMYYENSIITDDTIDRESIN